MAALGALGALGGTLRDLAFAPVRRWNQATTMHKIIAAGSGAALAYYLHKKGMADVGVAVAGLGGAYAVSALMHSRQVMANNAAAANGAALPATAPIAGALPPAQVQNMAAEAQAVMNSANGTANGNGSNGMSGSRWGALAPAAAPPVTPVGAPPRQSQRPIGVPAAPVGSQQSTGGGSKWSLLG